MLQKDILSLSLHVIHGGLNRMELRLHTCMRASDPCSCMFVLNCWCPCSETLNAQWPRQTITQQGKFGACNAYEFTANLRESACMWSGGLACTWTCSTHVVAVLVRVHIQPRFFCHSLKTAKYKRHKTKEITRKPSAKKSVFFSAVWSTANSKCLLSQENMSRLVRYVTATILHLFPAIIAAL